MDAFEQLIGSLFTKPHDGKEQAHEKVEMDLADKAQDLEEPSLDMPQPAPAAEEKKPDYEAQFKKKDKDSDGKLTLEEFKGKLEGDKATMAEKQFKRLDKDSDGKLTLEEFKTRMMKKKA